MGWCRRLRKFNVMSLLKRSVPLVQLNSDGVPLVIRPPRSMVPPLRLTADAPVVDSQIVGAGDVEQSAAADAQDAGDAG